MQDVIGRRVGERQHRDMRHVASTQVDRRLGAGRQDQRLGLAERQLAETAANEAELRRCLTCALGVVVEFGDLNGFRNTTDQELGKLVIVVAEESATTLNCPASAAAKRYEAMEAALQAAEEALTDMDMNHGGAGKALLMVRAALDRSTAPVCKESLHGEPDATPPAASD